MSLCLYLIQLCVCVPRRRPHTRRVVVSGWSAYHCIANSQRRTRHLSLSLLALYVLLAAGGLICAGRVCAEVQAAVGSTLWDPGFQAPLPSSAHAHAVLPAVQVHSKSLPVSHLLTSVGKASTAAQTRAKSRRECIHLQWERRRQGQRSGSEDGCAVSQGTLGLVWRLRLFNEKRRDYFLENKQKV